MTTITNKSIFLFTLIICFINQGCGDKIFGGDDDRLLIKNNAEYPIYVGDQINYPDTSIDNYNPSSVKDIYKILSNSEKRISSRSWEQEVGMSISDTLMIFIYDAYTLETIPWDTVRKNYLILKRYDLSLEDLQGMNWTITFP